MDRLLLLVVFHVTSGTPAIQKYHFPKIESRLRRCSGHLCLNGDNHFQEKVDAKGVSSRFNETVFNRFFSPAKSIQPQRYMARKRKQDKNGQLRFNIAAFTQIEDGTFKTSQEIFKGDQIGPFTDLIPNFKVHSTLETFQQLKADSTLKTIKQLQADSFDTFPRTLTDKTIRENRLIEIDSLFEGIPQDWKSSSSSKAGPSSKSADSPERTDSSEKTDSPERTDSSEKTDSPERKDSSCYTHTSTILGRCFVLCDQTVIRPCSDTQIA